MHGGEQPRLRAGSRQSSCNGVPEKLAREQRLPSKVGDACPLCALQDAHTISAVKFTIVSQELIWPCWVFCWAGVLAWRLAEAVEMADDISQEVVGEQSSKPQR